MIGKIYSCDDGFPHLIAEGKKRNPRNIREMER